MPKPGSSILLLYVTVIFAGVSGQGIKIPKPVGGEKSERAQREWELSKL